MGNLIFACVIFTLFTRCYLVFLHAVVLQKPYLICSICISMHYLHLFIDNELRYRVLLLMSRETHWSWRACSISNRWIGKKIQLFQITTIMQFQKQGCQISLESTSYSLISYILFRSRIVHHGDNNSHVICCTPVKVTWFEFSISGEYIFFKEINYMNINRMKTASNNICTLHIVHCGK